MITKHCRISQVVLLLLLSLVVSPSLFASDQFLNTCLQIAAARDKKLSVAAEQLRLAKTRVIKSGRGFLPNVMLQYRETRGVNNLTRSTDTAESSSITDEEYIAREQGIKISQAIYEGGRQRASFRYDKLMEEAARYNFTKVREELFTKIKVAYYELLSYRTEYTALKKAYTDIDALMNKVKNEYKAKAIAELDLVEAQNFHDKLQNLYHASELNLNLANKKLITLVGVDSLDSIPLLMPEGMSEEVPEVSFSLQESLGFLSINSLELKTYQTQILMAEQKRIMVRSKVIPKLYLDYFFGESGEAFADQDIPLARTYTFMARVSWGLWGNSLELIHSEEKTNPDEIIEPTARTENRVNEVRLGIFDDLQYFVDSKEAQVGYHQNQADYDEVMKKVQLDFEKTYGEYENSLFSIRTLKDEITLRRRKLGLMRKKNDLYEIPTVQLMEESWKYAETISNYGKALATNYSAVAEMERMTLMPLR